MLDPKEEDLVALAETCLATATQIKEYLAANNHPAMTFGPEGPAFFPAATPDIQHARLDLRAAAMRLYQLASGPDEILTWHAYHCAHDLNAFRYVSHYNVASAVPTEPNTNISYIDIATKRGLDPIQLRQMLRQLMAIRVFREPYPGMVSHTASSKLLTHWGVRAFNSFIAEDTFPAVARQIEALEKWGHGRPEPNRAALNLFYETDLPMYEYYETEGPELEGAAKDAKLEPREETESRETETDVPTRDNDEQITKTEKTANSSSPSPATKITQDSSQTQSQSQLRRTRFSNLMTYMSTNPIMSNSHVTAGFPWSSLPPNSVVVDVAGNVGHTAVAIARATHPSVRVIVQDLPKIIARATNPETSVLPEDLLRGEAEYKSESESLSLSQSESASRPRISFMPHNFYLPQPIPSAAVYFLRMILHDYSDPWALKILRAIVPAMGPDSKIVIMDQVMPDTPGMVPDPVERMMRTTDLQMMMLTNAKERDRGEWEELIGKAGEVAQQHKNKRLAILNIRTPVGSTMSLIEVGFVDDDGKHDAGEDGKQQQQ
ncbi:hypothetical protein ABEF95_017277 [Exophiala dermatitidis]